MAIERTDLKFAPQRPILWFGDGYIAQIINIVVAKNVLGQEVYKVRLLPSPELEFAYNITNDMTNEDKTIWVEYPVDMMRQVNADPIFPVWRCFLNFNVEECEGTKDLKGFIQAKEITSYRETIRILRAQVANLTEKYEKAKTNNLQFIHDEIMAPATIMNANVIAQQNQQLVGPVRQTGQQ